MAQDLSNMVVAFKEQSVLDTAVSGAGATGMELLPSQGFAQQIAQIVTGLLARSRMAGRSRQGSEFYNFAGEQELVVGAQNDALEAALGGTWVPAFTLDEADLTSVVISGGGTIITFGGGNVITEGVRHGMTAKFASLATSANNGKTFPILGISTDGRVLTVPTGILIDETIDSDFDFVVAAALSTTTPYEKRLFTFEQYLADIDRSLLGTNFRFNGVTFSINPDNMVSVSLAVGGTDLELLASGSSPNFTSPTFVEGESLVMLDGAIYFNGVKRVNLASFTVGLNAPISGLPLISRKTSIDAFLGQFAMDGQFTGVIEDGADFDAFKAEDQVSIYLHCAERSATDPYAQRYVGIYLPNMSFGGWSVPAGGEGAAIQTVPMNGGRDKRLLSLGFAQTSMLISTSN